jgi:hypothetical protein
MEDRLMGTKLRRAALMAALVIAAPAVFGADIDGTKPLICATAEGHACDPGLTCFRGLPASLGVPPFMRVNFTEQTIAGPKRTTPVRLTDNSGDQILLQGTELGFAWTMVINKDDGEMTLSFLSKDAAYIVFGNCTPS